LFEVPERDGHDQKADKGNNAACAYHSDCRVDYPAAQLREARLMLLVIVTRATIAILVSRFRACRQLN